MQISEMERKIEKMFLVVYMTAFDIVPADSKYYKENTCHQQPRF